MLAGVGGISAPKVFSMENGVGKMSVDDGLAAKISKCRTLGSGKSAMKVSAIGFGCMGMTYNRSSHPGKQECIKLIRNAVERGVSLFDTAIIYGPFNNEELVGEALEPFRGNVLASTKFGHEIVNGKGTGRQDSRPETIKRYCDDSLRRLRTDCIELFYQHRFDPTVPIEDVAGTIDAFFIKESLYANSMQQTKFVISLELETVNGLPTVCMAFRSSTGTLKMGQKAREQFLCA